MKCKQCKNDYSWHDWAQAPYCSPYCKDVAEGKYQEHSSGEWGRNAKTQLQEHGKDVLQPLNKDGTISKKFVNAHGTKTLQKELGMTASEIKSEAERYG